MKLKSLLAIIALLVIGCCLALLVFSAFTGSTNYLLAALFCLIVILPVFYGYTILIRYLKDKDQKKD